MQIIHVDQRRAVTALITFKQRISDFSSPALLFVAFEDCVCSVYLGFTSEDLEEHDLIF